MKMKQLVYRLANGTVERTLRDAVASGQRFQTEFVEVVEPTPMSAKRKQILAERGYVGVPSRF